jgi:hypothetical protein
MTGTTLPFAFFFLQKMHLAQAAFCEHDNEPSSFVKGGGFLD